MATDPVSSFARHLATGATTFVAWCSVPDPSIPEALVRAGFDAAVLDMQHGAFDYSSAARGIGAVAAAGKPALVRIPVGEFAMASRMLDVGAAAVIAPMINSVADAQAFVSFMKFPPVGARSWGPARALTLTGMDAATYLRDANSFHLAIAMIETAEALASIDAIVATPGIDGVLVGPSDLSIGLSGGAVVDPNSAEVATALRRIAERCRASHKLASVFCASGLKARELSAAGFQLCAISTDQLLLRTGAMAELDAARG